MGELLDTFVEDAQRNLVTTVASASDHRVCWQVTKGELDALQEARLADSRWTAHMDHDRTSFAGAADGIEHPRELMVAVDEREDEGRTLRSDLGATIEAEGLSHGCAVAALFAVRGEKDCE